MNADYCILGLLIVWFIMDRFQWYFPRPWLNKDAAPDTLNLFNLSADTPTNQS